VKKLTRAPLSMKAGQMLGQLPQAALELGAGDPRRERKRVSRRVKKRLLGQLPLPAQMKLVGCWDGGAPQTATKRLEQRPGRRYATRGG
jgi:hypothetical protein